MLHINEAIESRDFKTNNLFPVTTSHIPGSIQLDSSVLSSIFKINYRRLGSLSDNHEYIWDKVFKMSDKSFRSFKGTGFNPAAARQYAFAYMMQTDGVAASLIFRRIDLYDVPQQIIGPLGMVKNPLFVVEEDTDENATATTATTTAAAADSLSGRQAENRLLSHFLAFFLLPTLNHREIEDLDENYCENKIQLGESILRIF
jgi:hypothetical protein